MSKPQLIVALDVDNFENQSAQEILHWKPHKHVDLIENLYVHYTAFLAWNNHK